MNTRQRAGPLAGRAAAELDQHAREVLAEFGFPDDEIDALITEGVVRADSRARR